ncbi:hypoxia-inducible factor 1-alpha isoform X2 [Chrysoperla carnea]|uniref:hypoxia-inducible factor 1-alpha isoform X2 n=1 Tax=Chrysoperla carnea TaxID=189513 RepID=UPI001D075B34|nr:hypoxia-inducible factor 1-alpha isoform X2 [Chrysoperla carnea]
METTVVAKPKKSQEKRRNNEKRKEKSRDAARCRRSRETEIFSELANALPLSKEAVSQLDKASVMRLAISYLKIRDLVKILPKIEPPKELSEADDESVFLKALDGFMIVISDEGDIVYLSENVSEFLGISQVDLMGQNIYEYSHACDHDEVRSILTTKGNNEQQTVIQTRSFFLRLKCTITSKGRNVNLKSATYKVIHFTGHILSLETEIKKPTKDEDNEQNNNKNSNNSNNNQQKCLIAIGQPIPHPSNIEVPLDKKTFLSKHSLDMKFTYADEIMLDVLGFDPDDLVGKSVYDYHHALDNDVISSSFKSLFSKGQCETSRYRFLAKCGGYVWVVSQATVLHDKSHKPQSVVCVHYVISGIECKEEIYSISQQLAVTSQKQQQIESKVDIKEIDLAKPPTTVIALEKELKEKIDIKDNIHIKTDQDSQEKKIDYSRPRCTTQSLFVQPERPQTATSKIFAPRTSDMNKGFLMFSEEEGITILKDDPDDLTHLAPTAGDVCVPLPEFLTTEMFDDILSDTYCPLTLTDDLGSLDSSQSSNKTSSTSGISDPFMVYRDDFDFCKSELSTSPQLLSPNLSKSPGDSLPSLCSPGNSLSEDDHISSFVTLQMESEEENEFISKAPYISMNVGDDLPLLNMSEDLMWGALPPDDKILTQKTLNMTNTTLNSSLAQLLCQKTSTNQRSSTTYKTHDHGGGLINMSELLLKYGGDTRDTADHWTLQENNPLIEINKSPPEIPISNIKQTKTTSIHTDRAPKRSNANNNNQYGTMSKRCRSNHEPKEKLSSELLNQLMSNTPTRSASQTKQKNNEWPNSRTDQPPSDSVLMNLLGNGKYSGKDSKPIDINDSSNQSMDDDSVNNEDDNSLNNVVEDNQRLPNIAVLLGNRTSTIDNEECQKQRHELIRKNSFSLLDPEGRTIPSLMDLSQQDYDVNAPVNNTILLQGYELLNALEYSDPMMC